MKISQKSTRSPTRVPAEKLVRDIRRAARKHHCVEAKARFEQGRALRGEQRNAVLSHREAISESLYEPGPRTFAGASILPALPTTEARNQHRDRLRRLGAARHTLRIAKLSDSLAERNRRAIWGAMNAPGEDAAISRDSLPLASRGFRLVERV